MPSKGDSKHDSFVGISVSIAAWLLDSQTEETPPLGTGSKPGFYAGKYFNLQMCPPD